VQGPNGLYGGRNARVVDCRHALCAEVQRGRVYQCEENLSGRWTQCDYELEYADGSSTMGILMAEIITLLLSNNTRSHTGVIMGYNLATPQLRIHSLGVHFHPNWRSCFLCGSELVIYGLYFFPI